jgi:hypothetical protein
VLSFKAGDDALLFGLQGSKKDIIAVAATADALAPGHLLLQELDRIVISFSVALRQNWNDRSIDGHEAVENGFLTNLHSRMQGDNCILNMATRRSKGESEPD